MGPDQTLRLAGKTSFGGSYSLHAQHLRRPSAGSGVQLRSLQERWAAEQLDWFTSCSGSEYRMVLSQVVPSAGANLGGPQRDLSSPAIVVPPRIFSAIMFRAVCALAQRGTFGAAS